MNILINFATLKKGGGQNVALNFLESLFRIQIDGITFYFAASAGSEVLKFLVNKGENNIIIVPQNPLKRIIKEVIYGHYWVKHYKVDLIYTYFGIGLYPRFIPQVSGSADSNIYFPEINFWSEYTGIKKLSKALIDAYRIWGLKRMKAVIFENEIMEKRCIEMFNIKHTKYIKPSINITDFKEEIDLPNAAKAAHYRGLFFCGWQRNKNFMLIPLLASRFKGLGIDFHFIITANQDDSVDHKEFCNLIMENGVENMVSIIGSINKAKIASLYDQIDYVFLLSKLESFSNNIIEAWNFNKVLVMSDEEWARSIGKDAAIYVNRNNVDHIVNSVINLIENIGARINIIEMGEKMLQTYPNIEQRTLQEIDFLKTVYENN